MGKMNYVSPGQIISLDTNILISAFNKSSALGIKAIELLEEIKLKSPRVYISVLVFHEFLIKVYKDGLEKDIAGYEDFITGGGLFTVVDFDREIARIAAKIRSQHKSIRSPDALHLATAINKGSAIFFTFEKRLPKKIGNLKIQTLV